MLVIPRKLLEEMLEHARRCAPQEACGVIAGERRGGRGIARAVYRCRNVSSMPEVRYTIAPEDLVRALDDVEKKGMEVLGFYHSHPHGGVLPSAIDSARASWHGASYVIVNLRGEAAAWLWDEEAGRFRRERLLVVEEGAHHGVEDEHEGDGNRQKAPQGEEG
ncbi:MAG: M67 family metallopeptidase [Euryarchaeota archaeon]|nr:M67 family metallopeptidase [Euryarchaeota archaeon]